MTVPNWLTQILYDEIENRINNDPRTTSTTFLGCPRDRVFADVINGGQADFDAPLPEWGLSGFDRALLYAKYNQRRHLDELRHAFARLFGTATRIVNPTVIDIGCGPFTAGLSLAAVLGANESFRYFGIDRSKAMLDLANDLMKRARSHNALHANTTCLFATDPESVDFGRIRGELTIVVTSYLLASPSLDVGTLVTSILMMLERIGPGPVAIFYSNSSRPAARAKFPAFRDALIQGGFNILIDDIEHFDDTSRKSQDVHYALLFRQADNTLNL